MTTGNLSTISRVAVYGSTPFQHELTSPSLTGTWTVSTACSSQPIAPSPRPRSFASDEFKGFEQEQFLSLTPVVAIE